MSACVSVYQMSGLLMTFSWLFCDKPIRNLATLSCHCVVSVNVLSYQSDKVYVHSMVSYTL